MASKILNKRRPSISVALEARNFNKRRGAYSSKYSTVIMHIHVHCVVPVNMNSYFPTEEIGNFLGSEVSKTKNFKEMYEIKLEFQVGWGEGGSFKKSLLWGRKGYFMVLHITYTLQVTSTVCRYVIVYTCRHIAHKIGGHLASLIAFYLFWVTCYCLYNFVLVIYSTNKDCCCCCWSQKG